jgi:hypothetical protein
MKCILSVKQFGKTNYGSLTQAEFTSMIAAPFWTSALKYMKNSHLMVGDHKKGIVTSPESEQYMYSSGQSHPVNWRFKATKKEINPKLKKTYRLNNLKYIMDNQKEMRLSKTLS